MPYIQTALILFFLLLPLILKKKYMDEISGYSRKENALLFFYPAAILIADILEHIKKMPSGREGARFIRLHPRGDGREQYRRFVLHRYSMVLFVFLLFMILSAGAALMRSYKKGVLENNMLKRPDAGQDKVSLLFESDGIKETAEFNIRKRRLRGEELEEYFQMVQEELEAACFAGNESADRITAPLHFIESISDPDMSIRWRPEDLNLAGLDGRVNNENIDSGGVLTYLHLTLTYYEEEIREYTFPLRIYPPQLSIQEELKKELLDAYQKAEQDSIYEEYVTLPGEAGEAGEKEVHWTESRADAFWQMFLFGLAAAGAAYLAITNEVKKKEKRREKQMMLDYSNIISRFTLLMSAGMTIRGAWESIASEYEKKKAYEPMHYAYEEMVMAAREIKIGISEGGVYESFGKRCMLIPYIKFSSILVQNLKKGTAGILPLLEIEKQQAFSERKEISKRLGEEAGTKLQLPLMMYLLLVLVIVLVPAFSAL